MSAGGSNEPNLTPFIDLFSVLICFLLMTAAWIQLESLQVQIEEKPKVNPDQAMAAQPPPDKPPEKKVQLSVRIEKLKLVAKQDEQEREFSLDGLNIPEDFKSLMAQWKNRFPESQTLVINTANQASYGQLIRTYDVLNRSGWANVAINPY